MLKGDELQKVYDRLGIESIYTRIGGDMDDVEASAYVDAREMLDGRFYGVQLSLCAPKLDRGRSILEFEGVRNVVMDTCADVIVFKDWASWSLWDSGVYCIYCDYDKGVRLIEKAVSININLN